MAKKSLVKTPAGGRLNPANDGHAPVTPTATATAPASKAPAAKTQPAKAKPTREEIARRAFEIYMGRGQVAGRELEDWAQAERELIAEGHRNN